MNYFGEYPIHQSIRVPSAGHKSGAHLAWQWWLAGVWHGINDHVTQADTHLHWGTGAGVCQAQIISDTSLPILTCYYFWFRGIFFPLQIFRIYTIGNATPFIHSLYCKVPNQLVIIRELLFVTNSLYNQLGMISFKSMLSLLCVHLERFLR